MSRLLVKKIRKLLRLAQADGPEGEVARQCADELMRKHNLKVTLVEEIQKRVVVRDVMGSSWKENLLANIADICRCVVLHNDADKTLGLLVGSARNTRRTMRTYRKLKDRVENDAQGSWDVARRMLPAVSPIIEKYWTHIVSNVLVEVMAIQLRGPSSTAEDAAGVPTEKKPPVDLHAPDSEDAPESEQPTPDEQKSKDPVSAIEEMNKLATEIPPEYARVVREAAIQFGFEVGQQSTARIEPEEPREGQPLLAANGNI